MPFEMQAKLLRAIEEREIERVGGNQRINIDVRFISASNEELHDLVKAGRFRSDLYYRLNVVNIKLPPLKDRKRDVMLLAEHFLNQFSKDYPNCPDGFSKEAKHCLEVYPWPGNVRELRNVIESAVSLAKSKHIIASDLPDYIAHLKPANLDINFEGITSLQDLPAEGDLYTMMDLVEKQLITRALEKASGSKTVAAALLGIHRTALYKKMHKLGIED